MKKDNQIEAHLHKAKKLVYDKCGFDFSELMEEEESKGYGACRFRLNGLKIIFRIAKTTPTKTGQFVSLWKRNQEASTQAFDWTDEIDFVIISSKKGDKFGQFIFPKSVLLEKGIMSSKTQEGKRGIRVYPPWDTASNKQAEKTQDWQTKYFLTLDSSDKLNMQWAKQLLGQIDQAD